MHRKQIIASILAAGVILSSAACGKHEIDIFFPAEFDALWDELMADYLSAGGQDIIDERTFTLR